MDNLNEECLKTIVKGELYDFVAEHYWEMRKEDLKELVLNIYYLAVEGEDDEKKFNEILVNELKERGFADD